MSVKNRFSKYINILTKIKTISKKRYYKSKLEENKSVLRQVWKIISSIFPTNRNYAYFLTSLIEN